VLVDDERAGGRTTAAAPHNFNKHKTFRRLRAGGTREIERESDAPPAKSLI